MELLLEVLVIDVVERAEGTARAGLFKTFRLFGFIIVQLLAVTHSDLRLYLRELRDLISLAVSLTLASFFVQTFGTVQKYWPIEVSKVVLLSIAYFIIDIIATG